ncbi:MAG: hypothetical protein KMY53_12275 [Desulfarculus sp.]|nr:hypothetical protein [Pseudomonadota bacterium]MBV1716788.1 hypothetical protein [Desulfarculus sp.]MBU4573024.1 hypothetical protein [Pseudomonadota bacterium]MBU4596563.1 hypothetical protein [Pseudomonadota bacterium]MBV1738935.1 hypothetical protein [Desulfarculus sp.]
MGEEEIKVALESLRGQLRRLDTVLKMSVAEQRRINADLAAGAQNLGTQCRGQDQRLDRLETRLAAYTGGLFTLWLLFQVAQSLWR